MPFIFSDTRGICAKLARKFDAICERTISHENYSTTDSNSYVHPLGLYIQMKRLKNGKICAVKLKSGIT